MSTRFYPRFVKGNPQLRIFLPDWKMVLIKPKSKRHHMPNNVLTFKVDPKMTEWDIKNYLQKIYKINVAAINSEIVPGDLKNTSKGLSKLEDYRIAHVTLPLGEEFNWPDLFPKGKQEETEKEFELTMKEIKKNKLKDPNVQDVPNWFL